MVAQGTHTGVVADEFGGQNIIAIALPTTNTGTPAIQDWVGCGVASGFQLGNDPHTVTAYQTPYTSSDGTFHAIALLGNSANTLARVDLTSMLDTSIVPRDESGHFCAGGPLTNYPGIVSLIAW